MYSCHKDRNYFSNTQEKQSKKITLLDGKKYKKWLFNSNIIERFEYVEGIGCLDGLTFMGNCYFNLIQPEAIPVCYQGEHLVCASKNGQLLYQMSESEMKNIGAECKCLHKGIPNNIEIITTPTTTTQKIIRDGQLYIIKDGKTYNVMGIEIKDINF